MKNKYKGNKKHFSLGDRISNYFLRKTVYELQRAVYTNTISVILLDVRALTEFCGALLGIHL